MSITLKRAQLSDAEAMHMMQVTAFLPLLEKYHDTAINPACETLERVREKIAHSRCYFIMEDGRAVGGIRVVQGPTTGGSKVISPLFVLAGYRGRGVAKALLKACEAWAAERGCREFASDCELGNAASLQFHLHSGFAEANRIICFVKPLKPERGETHER